MLFHPATGRVRGTGVTSAPNAVLHPWLQQEVTQILAALPEPPACAPADLPPLRCWDTWLDAVPEGLPPLRLLLIWDNLAGHKSPVIVDWLLAYGVAPLYTPLSGSWLNMAESIQRIIVARALDGQHPENSPEVIDGLEATVRGWHRTPTPSPGAAHATSAVCVPMPGALGGQARRFHIPHQLRRDPLVGRVYLTPTSVLRCKHHGIIM